MQSFGVKNLCGEKKCVNVIVAIFNITKYADDSRRTCSFLSV